MISDPIFIVIYRMFSIFTGEPMKRLLLILLTLVYTSAVSGATFHLHFCGDHLQIVSFAGLGHDECCCAEDAPKKENCCTDKIVSIKVNENHTNTGSHFAPVSAVKIIPAVNSDWIYVYNFSSSTYSDIYHPPPPEDDVSQPSKLVMNCIFRI